MLKEFITPIKRFSQRLPHLPGRSYKRLKYLKFRNYPGLNGRIHIDDTMFVGDMAHYMSVGQSAVNNIQESLTAANLSLNSLRSILDIPSGYGRVLRVLASKVHPEKITACDIQKEQIEFCAKEFGCKQFLSSTDLSKIHFPENYSLIWVGSLFTHFNEKDFTDLLKLLFESLEDNGLLIITTHGKYAVEIFEKYWGNGPVPASREELQKTLDQNNGFYFAPYPYLPSYGISISLKEYVDSLFDGLFREKAKIVRFAERGWDNHQDVFSIQKVK